MNVVEVLAPYAIVGSFLWFCPYEEYIMKFFDARERSMEARRQKKANKINEMRNNYGEYVDIFHDAREKWLEARIGRMQAKLTELQTARLARKEKEKETETKTTA